MRGFLIAAAIGGLLLTTSYAAGHHWPTHGETVNGLWPGVATGKFGEQFPVLMLVPVDLGGGYGSAAPADGLPATMPPAEDGPAMPPVEDKKQEKRKVFLRTSRPAGTPAGLAREIDAAAKVRRAAASVDVTGLSAADAEPLFWKGCRLYWEGQAAEALPLFEAATRLHDQDARFWYYRSLAEWSLGQDKAADVSAKRGAELQERGLPSAGAISQSLERVQGEARARLRRAAR